MQREPSNFDEPVPEISCPCCAARASWRFLDSEQKTVEVMCPDCGVYELPRAEFEKAEQDVAEPFEP